MAPDPTHDRMPAEDLATLLRVSTALAASLELPVVLQTAIESAVEVLRLDTGAIYLLDGDSLYLGATTPPLPPDLPDELRLANVADHPHIARCLAEGGPVYVPDMVTADLTPAERQVADARDLRSLLFLPLLVENRPVGTLIVGCTEGVRAFESADIDLCRTLSAEIALAVSNARLFTSLHDLNRDLERLVQERTEELAAANEELHAQAEELQAQAADLEEQTELLTEANEAKARFVRSMSHELRTPLNSIIGFSDVILGGLTGDVTEEQRRQLEMINASGRHLLELINDILDLARIDADVLNLRMAPVDVSALVRGCVDAITPGADAKGLHLVADVPQPSPALVSDAARVKQILLNLLDNAVKYTPSGTVTLSVRTPGNGLVAFEVTDTGPGIAAESQEAVFAEFERGGSPEAAHQPGTGLGLPISRRLAAALGGTVTLVSAEGAGSTFTLTLPEDAAL